MIRVVCGLKGSGKTYGTLARLINSQRPVMFYTPSEQDELKRFKTIDDTGKYLGNGLKRYFKQTKFVVCKWRGNTVSFFDNFDLVNCEVVLDDFPTLVTEADEKRCVKRMIPLVRRAGLNIWITAHIPYSDVPKKVRELADVIEWWGPLKDNQGINDMWNIGQTCFQGSFEQFKKLIIYQPKRRYFRLR